MNYLLRLFRAESSHKNEQTDTSKLLTIELSKDKPLQRVADFLVSLEDAIENFFKAELVFPNPFLIIPFSYRLIALTITFLFDTLIHHLELVFGFIVDLIAGSIYLLYQTVDKTVEFLMFATTTLLFFPINLLGFLIKDYQVLVDLIDEQLQSISKDIAIFLNDSKNWSFRSSKERAITSTIPHKQYIFTVSEAAHFLGVSADTLRNWEEKGKLIPERTSSGYRKYTYSQLKKYAPETPVQNVVEPIETYITKSVTVPLFNLPKFTFPTFSVPTFQFSLPSINAPKFKLPTFNPPTIKFSIPTIAPRYIISSYAVIAVSILLLGLIANPTILLKHQEQLAALLEAQEKPQPPVVAGSTSSPSPKAKSNLAKAASMKDLNHQPEGEVLGIMQGETPSKEDFQNTFNFILQPILSLFNFGKETVQNTELAQKVQTLEIEVQKLSDQINNQKIISPISSPIPTNISSSTPQSPSPSSSISSLPAGITYTDLIGKTIIDSLGNIYPQTGLQVSVGTWDRRYYGLYLNNIEINANGDLKALEDIQLGSASEDNISFVGQIASNFNPSVNNTYTLGNDDKKWKDIFSTAITTNLVTLRAFSGSGTTSLLSGEGVPDNSLGSNGNYYFRTDGTDGATSLYYKVSGAWTAAGGSGGGSAISIQEGDTELTSAASALDFLAADFTLSESPSGEANISIDYTNSGITRKAENETISGQWAFSNIDINGGAIDGTAIGATSASTGNFTTISLNGTSINTAGTLTNVAYLNQANSFGEFNQTFDTTTLFIDASSNEVGIGTTSPGQKLEVASGNAYINNGQLMFSNITDSPSASTNLQIFAYSGRGHIGSAGSLNFDIDTDNDETGRSFNFRNNGLEGGSVIATINESGYATFGSSSDLAGSTYALYSNGATYLNGAITGSSTVNFDSGTLYVDATNNRVGVGVTTIGKALETVGEIVGRTSSSSGGVASSFATSTSGLTLWVNSSYDPSSPSSGWTRGLDIDTSGEVGIGNSTPGYKLDVIATSNLFRLGYDTSNYYITTVSSTGNVNFNATGTGSSFTFADSVQADTFSSSGATLTGGTINNIAIGGSTPAAGTFTTLNATTIQLGGTSINTAGTLTNVAYLNQANAFSANQNFNLGFDVDDAFTVADGGGSLVIADNFYQGLGASAGRIEFDDQTVDEVNILAANMGLGTATPNLLSWGSAASVLTIAGNSSNGNGVLELSGNTVTGSNTYGSIAFIHNADSVAAIQAFREGADDAANLRFYTQATGGANAERMRITSAGIVWIGDSGGTNSNLDGTDDLYVEDELEVDGAFYLGDGGDAGSISSTTLDIDATGALQINSSGGAISIGNDAVAQAINIGTGAAARTITTGNATGATALVFNSGTGAQTFTSQVVSTSTTSSAFVFDATALTTGTGLYLTADALTTGKLAQIATTGNTLTTGTLLDLRTTATSLTGTAGTGSLLNLDWTPGSSTTATGDLFALSLGSNGNVGTLFNIYDSGSSIFNVSESAVTANIPVAFQAPGDTSMAYDLNFTNPTASYIKSNAPLYLQSGETFNSSNLTFKTFNQGAFVFDSAVTTGTLIDITNSTLTTGTGINASFSAQTTGTAFALTSTGTITSGGYLANLTANSATTGTVVNISGNGLTSGDALAISSSATALTGNLVDITLSGSNASNTGSIMRITNSGTSNANAALMVTNLGGSSSTSFRVNDETGDADTSPFLIDASGNVAIGQTSATEKLEVAGNIKLTGVIKGSDIGARVYHSTTQSISNNTTSTLSYDSESFDTDGMHYTSSANLTGTVSKTATSTTLTGSGTAFTSELSVGQVISVPGTAAEKRVVTAIASDTSLTVGVAFDNTASGQTATRVNSALVATKAGKYILTTNFDFANNSTGLRWTYINGIINGVSTQVGYTATAAVNGDTTRVINSGVINMNQYDYAESQVFQNSGGALNMVATINIFSMIRVSGADLAEYYGVKDKTIEEGDVVSVSSNTVAGQLGSVEKSAKEYQKTAGIISTNPALILGNNPDKENSRLVGLKGKVPVKVVLKPGQTITAGDNLATSTLPGFAMKALRPGYIVAQALDNFNPASLSCKPISSVNDANFPENSGLAGNFDCFTLPSGETLVMINAILDNSWADTGGILATILDQSILNTDGTIAKSEFDQNLTDPKVLELENLVKAQNEKIDNLQSSIDNLNTAPSTASVSATALELIEERLRKLEEKEATSNPVIARNQTILANDSQPMTNDILGLSEVLGEATESAKFEQVSSSILSTFDATISATLKSLGDTFLGDTNVAGEFSVDGTLSITGNSINSLASNCHPEFNRRQASLISGSSNSRFRNEFGMTTECSGDQLGVLYIQDNPLATLVNFFNGVVKIDNKGNIATTGQIFAQKANFSAKSVGSGTIKTGNTSTTINSELITLNSKVLVTPTTLTGNRILVVTNKTEGKSFTVRVESAFTKDIQFDWWIVDQVQGEINGEASTSFPKQASVTPLSQESSSLSEREASKQSLPSIEGRSVTTLTVNDNELGFLRVRELPTTSSPEVTQVLPGEIYSYSEEKGGWYQVELPDGRTGWVKGIYVTINQ